MAGRKRSGNVAAPRQASIVETIRGWIVSGRYGPGRQLPKQTDLMRSLGAGTSTVQMALKRLAFEGFIEGRRPAGTFVVDRPPHLNHYGLVFFRDPQADTARHHWSRYYQALTLAASRFQMETGRRIIQFHGIDWHGDAPERKRLVAHLKAQQLAGVIFANAVFYLEGSPILELPGIPRVALETESRHPLVHPVSFYAAGDGSWMAKALAYIAGRGRRRVALVEYGMPAALAAAWEEGLARWGLTSHPRWRQTASLRYPDGVRRSVELLMHDAERPDALLVADDNFVEPAQAGLAACGVRVPEDVIVVGHANYPLPPAKSLPVRLLGHDMSEVLRVCVRLIDDWRRGVEPPAITSLSPIWEEEYEERCKRRSWTAATQSADAV